MLPEYPIVLGGWRLRDSDLILTGATAKRTATISGQHGMVHALAEVLGRCSGSTPLSVVMDGISPLLRAEVVDALLELREAGLLVDARRRPGDLISALQRFAPGPDNPVLPRAGMAWADPRCHPGSDSIPAEPRSRRRSNDERPRSLPIRDLPEPLPPVTAEEVTTLLSRAYRTEGEWKPVASAGRLWPLVLHALIPQQDSYELFWFDPDAAATIFTGVRLDSASFQASFLQTDVLEASIGRRRPLIVISADLSHVGEKYGNRGALYAVMETGAVAHQLSLSAASRGIATRTICGFVASKLQHNLSIAPRPLAVVLVERWRR
jgi:hypothetical protein